MKKFIVEWIEKTKEIEIHDYIYYLRHINNTVFYYTNFE